MNDKEKQEKIRNEVKANLDFIKNLVSPERAMKYYADKICDDVMEWLEKDMKEKNEKFSPFEFTILCQGLVVKFVDEEIITKDEAMQLLDKIEIRVNNHISRMYYTNTMDFIEQTSEKEVEVTREEIYKNMVNNIKAENFIKESESLNESLANISELVDIMQKIFKSNN